VEHRIRWVQFAVYKKSEYRSHPFDPEENTDAGCDTSALITEFLLLLPPQQRRPLRQFEHCYLRRQCLVQNGSDDVGHKRREVNHAAHIAVVYSLALCAICFIELASPDSSMASQRCPRARPTEGVPHRDQDEGAVTMPMTALPADGVPEPLDFIPS
jgi:hypothetical protein